ncbi:N-acetylmuramidase domain-containing protein [Nannocystis sp.]|uniref:N-acetylmuramidase domain-containing protein n=1 Tax=Nannocystis sp. TaxID=1962667 RepID=UPI0025DAA045|nr:N-acetylmuramidase domain-containing protein [Nannocystis sp.]MBK7823652.1 DUF3380 domain-containing protein [Nannocystis sp.]
MFSFIKRNPTCLAGLKAKDYVKFATGYNGSGKAADYAQKLKAAADAYARVTQD